MSKRIFDLPGIDELTKGQKAVRRLNESGQHLVIGGPGTGKSVVALLRAKKFHHKNNYLFLTFNHVLNSSTKQVCGIELKSDTAQSWFYNLQFNLAPWDDFDLKKMPHKVDSNGREIQHSPDYDKVIERFDSYIDQELPNLPATDIHFIIDEGQDLPVGFYESLQSLGYENFFIVADQNQQITEENSSIQELADVLALDWSRKEGEPNDVIELEDNWRNSYAIALFSQQFYTDKATPPPILPSKPLAWPTAIDTPVFYVYQMVNSCVSMIHREAMRDTSKLIGVIVATEPKRETYTKFLTKTSINDNINVSSYSQETKQNVNIDFSMGGIVVLCDKSVKGIEFDAVFIVLDDLKVINNDTDAVKKRLYVMSSRAKEKLFLLRSAAIPSEVEELLPTDEKLMIRDNI
ncbi:MAG: ATP-binding domain-containing protein [Colwellia sp.]